MSPEFGAKALEEIGTEFGPNKAIFIKTDVTDIKEFEGTYDYSNINSVTSYTIKIHGHIVSLFKCKSVNSPSVSYTWDIPFLPRSIFWIVSKLLGNYLWACKKK